MTLRARVGKYLREKRNFIKVGTVAFGVPFTAVTLWIAGGYGGVGWWLFLVALAFAASWLWALGMWFVLESDLRKISDLEKQGKQSEAHQGQPTNKS